MKKLTIPKIHLTKKQIVLVSAVVLAIIVSSILKNQGKEDAADQSGIQENIQENTGEGYANDADETVQYNTFQKIYSTETEPKILVYGEISDDPYGEGSKSIDLTEKCQYEDKEAEENIYTLGSTPIEVKNHCILSFEYQVDLSETVDTLTAYIVLPDDSLVAVSSKGGPSVQVNIFEHETRIIQQNGFAYYRISPQENNDIFTVELNTLSQIFTATGTELYAESGLTLESFPQYELDEENNFVSGFFLYDGSGYVRARGSNEILQTMSSDDNTSTYFSVLSLVTYKPEKLPLLTDALDSLDRGDFLNNQKAWSEKYGLGNFSSFTTDTLKAFVYDHTEDVYAKTVTNVEKMKEEENRKWEEMQADDDDYTSSSGSYSTGSSSSSEQCYAKGTATYQLFCVASNQGTIKNGKCCID